MPNLAPVLAQSTPVVPNSVVQDLSPIVDPTVSTPSTDAIDINNPTVRTLIETARSEEKTKLYATIEALKEEIKGLKSKLSEKMSPDEKMVQMIEDLQRQAAEATTRFNALVNEVTVERQNYTTALNNARLQSYLDRRLREEKDKGTKLVLEMVTGSTEQEIEQSIVASAAEEARRRSMYLQEFQQQYGTNGVVTPISVTAVPVVVSPAIQPSAFPAPLNAAPVSTVDPGTEAFATRVAELTSPEAVRSGSYAENRAALMAAIRQGKVPPAGQPFANMPRAYVPQSQHGQVTQPQGHPSGPVTNPNMQTNVAQPLPIATTQPVTATGNQPVMAPVPTSGSEAAAMRAQAVQHATNALANPAFAGRADVRSGRPPTHPEYRGVAVHNPVFDGRNPMERTT